MRSLYTYMSLVFVLTLLTGCVTVGYSYAKNAANHYAWPATVISVEDQNIYNSTGAAWVGALAKVEAVGLKVAVVLQNGQRVTMVQPKDPGYTLSAGESVNYIEDSGRVWAQPTTMPLPSGVVWAPGVQH